MNRIQRLFEIIVGVTQDENYRWAQPHAAYHTPKIDCRDLQTPACWRRSAQIRRAKR